MERLCKCITHLLFVRMVIDVMKRWDLDSSESDKNLNAHSFRTQKIECDSANAAMANVAKAHEACRGSLYCDCMSQIFRQWTFGKRLEQTFSRKTYSYSDYPFHDFILFISHFLTGRRRRHHRLWLDRVTWWSYNEKCPPQLKLLKQVGLSRRTKLANYNLSS
jgi:hypothetical protein